MSSTTIALLVIFVVFIALLAYFVGIYNKLVNLRNRFKNAFAQIAVQLKRRYDPGEVFSSDWYGHYKNMFADRL